MTSLQSRVREAADRVERLAPLGPSREPDLAGRRVAALALVCDELHVEQHQVVAELVRRREARIGARQ